MGTLKYKYADQATVPVDISTTGKKFALNGLMRGTHCGVIVVDVAYGHFMSICTRPESAFWIIDIN